MRFAVYHDLRRAGGASTVLAEVVRQLPAHEWSLYTPATDEGEDLLGLDALFGSVTKRRLTVRPGVLGIYGRMLTLPLRGAILAGDIDAGGHDAVFVLPSQLVQAPEILPHLRTPSLYYAPEPLRAAYDVPQGLRARISPYTSSRKRQDRANIHAATKVMTHSRYTAERLCEIYGVKARVVALGVDAERMRPAAVRRERYVLSVGALDPLKGHDFVIDAVARLADDTVGVVIVADRGDRAPELEARARALGLDLEILQSISAAAVLDRYRRAGVVACAAYGEPFGLTPLEAMATATPVVAVDEGGYRETVRDGVDGLRTPRDLGLFSAALASVLGDGALAARLGAAGREAAATRWTWKATADGVQALLESVAEAR